MTEVRSCDKCEEVFRIKQIQEPSHRTVTPDHRRLFQTVTEDGKQLIQYYVDLCPKCLKKYDEEMKKFSPSLV